MKKQKARQIVNAQRKSRFRLTQDEIHLILELSQEHPRWSVDRVFKEAARPKVRTGIVFYPTPKIMQALREAADGYDVSVPFVLHDLLFEWYRGYQARKERKPK